MSTKTLRMIFTDAEGRTRAISLRDPVESPSAVLVEQTMDHIITQDIFKPSFVSLVEKVKAEVVERSVDEIYDATA